MVNQNITKTDANKIFYSYLDELWKEFADKTEWQYLHLYWPV